MRATDRKVKILIDGLQYSNWSRAIFEEIRAAGIAAVHATVTYHGNFLTMLSDIGEWNRFFCDNADIITPARSAQDILDAQAAGRVAFILGTQNPSPLEDNIDLVQASYDLGIRVMQLTYNVQSLLASGCFEPIDSGVTLMGRDVIREMNRVGILIDMSHSAERSTLDAIEVSERPITISHANPSFWHEAPRSKSETVIRALGESGGMLGFSLYTHHLRGGADCTLKDFCKMVARVAEMIGPEKLGIGSDLCQGRPDSSVAWMRNGLWRKDRAIVKFPQQPGWFACNSDFPGLANGLRGIGFSEPEVAGIMGRNWLDFYARSFGPAGADNAAPPNV